MIKGWSNIILGLLFGALVIWGFCSSYSSIQEAKNIRENGYFYSGNSNLTIEQYDEIKQYDGFHNGTVIIKSINPLLIEYNFGSLQYYSYLQDERFNSFDKSINALSDMLFLVSGIIPILFIIRGITQLMEIRKVRQEGFEGKC
jgi:hypothetical protein